MRTDIEKRLCNLESSSSGLFGTEFVFTYSTGETKKLTGRKALLFIIEAVFGTEKNSVVSIAPPGSVIDIISQLSNPVPNRDIEAFGSD